MRLRVPSLLLLAVAAGALALLVAGRPSRAEAASPHTVYLTVSGDGQTAKAWYRGASPVGVPVQDALDALSQQGYRVKAVTAGERPVVVTQATSAPLLPERSYLILLEK